MPEMSNTRRAEMYFKQAMKKDEAGDIEATTNWLDKAAEAELAAARAGEPRPNI